MQGVQRKKPGRPADPQRCQRRRDEIVNAAAGLFAKHGYSGLDTQVLANSLGVGKGTLYRYFPSKEALFLAVVDDVMRKLKQVIDSSMVGAGDVLEGIRRAVRAYLTFFAENRDYVELLIQERAHFKDRKKPTFFEHREANSKRWQSFYRDLIAKGRVRRIPVKRITDVFGDLVYGTMFTNYFVGQRKSPGEQAKDILDIVFNGILSEAERSAK